MFNKLNFELKYVGLLFWLVKICNKMLTEHLCEAVVCMFISLSHSTKKHAIANTKI